MRISSPLRALKLVQIIISIAVLTLPLNTAMVSAQVGNSQPLPEKLKGHGGPVKSIVLDGSDQLALSSSFDYSIILWDLSGKTGKIKYRMLGHKAAVNDIAFIPNKSKQPTQAVSVSDDGSFAIWDLSTGKLSKMIEDTGDKVLDVAVSPDGKYAAVARWDATARVYDLNLKKQIHSFKGHKANVNSVVFGKNSNLLYTASYDGDIRAWYVSEEKKVSKNNQFDFQHGGIIHSNGWGINVISLLPSGDKLLIGALNGALAKLDLKSRAVKEIGNYQHPILSIAQNEKSGWLAVGASDGHIRIFDMKSFKLLEDYKNFIGPVWGLAFSRNGKTLYRSGLDDFISRWQVSPREGFKISEGTKLRRFQMKLSSDPGEVEFQRKCSVCHTLIQDDKNRAGPTLYKLFGREAGSLKGYKFSKALIKLKLIWNEETISRLFDEGPDIVTPGSKMPVQRLKAVHRRDALIQFLKKATAPN